MDIKQLYTLEENDLKVPYVPVVHLDAVFDDNGNTNLSQTIKDTSILKKLPTNNFAKFITDDRFDGYISGWFDGDIDTELNIYMQFYWVESDQRWYIFIKNFDTRENIYVVGVSVSSEIVNKVTYEQIVALKRHPYEDFPNLTIVFLNALRDIPDITTLTSSNFINNQVPIGGIVSIVDEFVNDPKLALAASKGYELNNSISTLNTSVDDISNRVDVIEDLLFNVVMSPIEIAGSFVIDGVRQYYRQHEFLKPFKEVYITTQEAYENWTDLSMTLITVVENGVVDIANLTLVHYNENLSQYVYIRLFYYIQNPEMMIEGTMTDFEGNELGKFYAYFSDEFIEYVQGAVQFILERISENTTRVDGNVFYLNINFNEGCLDINNNPQILEQLGGLDGREHFSQFLMNAYIGSEHFLSKTIDVFEEAWYTDETRSLIPQFQIFIRMDKDLNLEYQISMIQLRHPVITYTDENVNKIKLDKSVLIYDLYGNTESVNEYVGRIAFILSDDFFEILEWWKLIATDHYDTSRVDKQFSNLIMTDYGNKLDMNINPNITVEIKTQGNESIGSLGLVDTSLISENGYGKDFEILKNWSSELTNTTKIYYTADHTPSVVDTINKEQQFVIDNYVANNEWDVVVNSKNTNFILFPTYDISSRNISKININGDTLDEKPVSIVYTNSFNVLKFESYYKISNPNRLFDCLLHDGINMPSVTCSAFCNADGTMINNTQSKYYRVSVDHFTINGQQVVDSIGNAIHNTTVRFNISDFPEIQTLVKNGCVIPNSTILCSTILWTRMFCMVTSVNDNYIDFYVGDNTYSFTHRTPTICLYNLKLDGNSYSSVYQKPNYFVDVQNNQIYIYNTKFNNSNVVYTNIRLQNIISTSNNTPVDISINNVKLIVPRMFSYTELGMNNSAVLIKTPYSLFNDYEDAIRYIQFDNIDFISNGGLLSFNNKTVQFEYGSTITNSYFSQAQFNTIYSGIANAKQLEIRNCVFKNTNIHGSNSPVIRADGLTLVDNCEFVDFGYNAVWAGTLISTPSSVYETYSYITNNKIYYTPEYAKFAKIFIPGDSGAIYVATVNKKAVIAYNEVHNIIGIGYNNGIYCDDDASNVYVLNNLVYNILGKSSHSVTARHANGSRIIPTGYNKSTNKHICYNIVDNNMLVGHDPITDNNLSEVKYNVFLKTNLEIQQSTGYEISENRTSNNVFVNGCICADNIVYTSDNLNLVPITFQDSPWNYNITNL